MGINTEIMDAKNAITGSLGSVYATIDGNRYKLLNLTKIEAKLTKTKKEIRVIGSNITQNRSTELKGTGTCSFYYNSSIFRELAKKYKDEGIDTYFEMIITNEDPTSTIGKQTILLENCNFDDIILAKIDISSDVLEEDMAFTFDKWDLPETFELQAGMQ